ncbi:MAG: hypothetical protein EAZ91_16505 [Cytophagales bacterium]|nr:MAG: hypothetical protein EAZ91_16505 [Cytophagales bacterium]
MVNIEGLKDTLQANRDTLQLRVEVSQPTVYRNMARGFNGKNEQVQLPANNKFNFGLNASRMFVTNPSSLSADFNMDSNFVRIPVYGVFRYGDGGQLITEAEQSRFVGKYLPTKKGLYVVQLSNGVVWAKDINMETHPSFNLPSEKRNFHLLSEQMKINMGITNDYGRRTSIAFYVK